MRTVTVYSVTTQRLVKGVLDLLGRGWTIVTVTEEQPQHFRIDAYENGAST